MGQGCKATSIKQLNRMPVNKSEIRLRSTFGSDGKMVELESSCFHFRIDTSNTYSQHLGQDRYMTLFRVGGSLALVSRAACGPVAV